MRFLVVEIGSRRRLCGIVMKMGRLMGMIFDRRRTDLGTRSAFARGGLMWLRADHGCFRARRCRIGRLRSLRG